MAEQLNSLEELGAVAAAPAAEVEAPREPVRDAQGRSYATGKRKDAVARVWVKPGSGKVTVNGKDINAYFARPVLQMILRQPFKVIAKVARPNRRPDHVHRHRGQEELRRSVDMLRCEARQQRQRARSSC